MKKLQRRMMRRADRRRHRRRRLHRQPHGRSVARARLSRARHRQSGRRPRGEPRPPRATIRGSRSSSATSARSSPATRCSRAPTTSSTSPASATSCPRSSGRSTTWTPTSRAPCACWNARARPACRSSSMRRRRPATASPHVPTREDHPIAPQYPYALSKYQGEQAALHWHQVYRLPVNSIRIFNAYGPRVRTTGAYGAVFGVFFKQKLAGKPFTVVGDGTQTARFPLRHRRRRGVPARRPKAASAGEIWNLGAGNPQIVNRLVELLGGAGRPHPEAAGRARLHLGGHHQDHARSRLEADGAVRGGRPAHAGGHRALARCAAVGPAVDRARDQDAGSSIWAREA